MAIDFACHKCQAIYTVPDEVAGQETTCRRCQSRIFVPARALPVTIINQGPSRVCEVVQTFCLIFIATVVAIWLIGTYQQEMRREKAMQEMFRPR